MGTDRADGAAPGAEQSMTGTAIADAWIGSLQDPSDRPQRGPDLIAAYRDLADAAIGHAGVEARPASPSVPPEAALDRAVRRVAAANRRAGRSISDALRDVTLLMTVAATTLIDRTDEGGTDPRETLRWVMRAIESVGLAARRLVLLLERAGRRAEREHAEALQAMTDMVSHELRNRLGAARTASQMLTSPNIRLDEDGIVRATSLVESSVEAALHTVDDVRAIAASRSSLDSPSVRPVDLATLVRSVCEELRPRALEAGVRLDVVAGDGTCDVDAARVRLVLTNLVGNGIKYADPTGDAPFVRVGSQASDDVVRLTVSDNGIGIAADELDDVFLHRVRGSETGDRPGSGLGLAIASEAIEQMGGRISVESAHGEGTTFEAVFVPLGQGEPASA